MKNNKYNEKKLNEYITERIILSGKFIEVLEAIKKLEPTYIHEIAKEIGVSDSSILTIINKLLKSKITVKATLAINNDSDIFTKKTLSGIFFTIDDEDLKNAIKHFKKGREEIKEGLNVLEKSRNRFLNKLEQKPISSDKKNRIIIDNKNILNKMEKMKNKI